MKKVPDIITEEARKLSEQYFVKGECCELDGKFEDAMKNYAESIIFDPTYKLAYFKLGILNESFGKKDVATGYYKTVIRLCKKEIASETASDKEKESALNDIATAYQLMGNTEKAEKYFGKAYEIGNDAQACEYAYMFGKSLCESRMNLYQSAKGAEQEDVEQLKEQSRLQETQPVQDEQESEQKDMPADKVNSKELSKEIKGEQKEKILSLSTNSTSESKLDSVGLQ